MTHDPVVAIAGVTGAVGAEFIATMDRRGFRVGKLKVLASARSAGKTVDFRGQKLVIEELTEHSFALLSTMLLDSAARHCNSRVVSMLEGGYNLEALAGSVEEHLKVLLNR